MPLPHDRTETDDRDVAPDAFVDADRPHADRGPGDAPSSPGPAPDAFGAGVECARCGARLSQKRARDERCPRCGEPVPA
ncbi:MAG TPA: hypothetical protein VM618_02755 [Acidimicrobiia bacterium]|jgi:hypothetical protein|nr:hypothetical protein [Acidimicrobiia bacterium]